MDEKLYLIVLDLSGITIEVTKIKKPKTFDKLKVSIKYELKNVPNNYQIFYQKDGKNIEIVNDDETYLKSKDILFVKEVDKLKPDLSLEKFSSSKREILEDRYSCVICKDDDENEDEDKGKMLLCYQCQKVFHELCLEKWKERCESRHMNFHCPNCRYELPLNDWVEKVNYEDEKKYEKKLFKELNEKKLKDNVNENINRIHEKKYNDLKQEFDLYKENNSKILKKILNTTIEINFLIDNKNNENSSKLEDPGEISDEIYNNLNNIRNFIKGKQNKNIIIENNINDANNNYIKGIIEVKNDNETLRILNSFKRPKSKGSSVKDQKPENYKEIENIEIKINEKIIPFNYFYKFEKQGKYDIEYTFKEPLTNADHLFHGCESLISLDLSKFKTENINNMSNMFYGCESLIKLNLSGFNTEKVTDMQFMFYGCESLKNIDLSKFNTKNVINMSQMFYGCKSLTNLDLSKFNTENVTNMDGMFSNCLSFKTLDLSKLNTKKVTNMAGMFSRCKSLIYLDLSKFNTEKTTDMSHMFSKCETLAKLDLASFNTQNVGDMADIFNGCKCLIKRNVITKDIGIKKEFE